MLEQDEVFAKQEATGRSESHSEKDERLARGLQTVMDESLDSTCGESYWPTRLQR